MLRFFGRQDDPLPHQNEGKIINMGRTMQDVCPYTELGPHRELGLHKMQEDQELKKVGEVALPS